MNEPNWAIVLEALHEGELATGQNKGGPARTKYELDQFSVSETGLSESEIEDALEYLDNCGLITKYTVYSDEDTRTVGGLTEKGFDVAHERELTKSQHETSKRSARLSAYLVMAIIIQTAISFSPSNTNQLRPLLVGFAIVGLLILAVRETIEYRDV